MILSFWHGFNPLDHDFWKVGMLSLGCPKINFQFETPNCHERLLEAVKAQIPEEAVTEDEEDESSRASTPSESDNNQLAFQVCTIQVMTYSESIYMARRGYCLSMSDVSSHLSLPLLCELSTRSCWSWHSASCCGSWAPTQSPLTVLCTLASSFWTF